MESFKKKLEQTGLGLFDDEKLSSLTRERSLFSAKLHHPYLDELIVVVDSNNNHFNIRIREGEQQIGVLNAVLNKEYWNVFHRKIEADYQGEGLGSVMFGLAERIAQLSDHKKIGMNIVEDGFYAGEHENVDVVQGDLMMMALDRGYVPKDKRAAELIEQVRSKVGFTQVNHIDGDKFIPEELKDLDIEMYKDLAA